MKTISFSGKNRVHLWEYEILQADPEVTFPAAEVIYGDSLKKATLSGQSGEGVFRFCRRYDNAYSSRGSK